MILYQFKEGYCYNSDTHFLFDFIDNILKGYKNIQGNLLDIGSGSGILGFLVKQKYNKLKLNSIEIQKEYCKLLKINAKVNKIECNIINGDFLKTDFKNKFDIIISNPPFYPNGVIESNKKLLNIARYEKHLPLSDFIKKVSILLNNKGKLFFCYDEKKIDDIFILTKKYNLKVETIRFLHPKKGKNASLVMVYCKKNSKTSVKILSPLIMFEKDKFSDEVKNIYSKINLHSIKINLEDLDDY